MARRALAVAAAVAAAAAAAPANTPASDVRAVPGSLSYLRWRPGSKYAPELALLDLASNASSVVADWADMSYESLFIESSAYDWRSGLLILSMQADANISQGALLEVNLTSRSIVRAAAAPYCWFLALDAADDNTLLCLTGASARDGGGRAGPAGGWRDGLACRAVRHCGGGRTCPAREGVTLQRRMGVGRAV